MKITGLMMQYFYICERKLWLHLKGIAVENLGNEHVALGKELENNFYKRAKKNLSDGIVNIDTYDKKEKQIVEIKKSSKNIKAARLQLLYYMYYTNIVKGVIKIPKERKKITVILDDHNITEVKTAIEKIEIVNNLLNAPPLKHNKICLSCSFQEICYI